MKAVVIVLLVAIFAACIDARSPRELIERARRYAAQSDQNNNFNFGANVNNGQWGVNGQYQRQWNGGNTNLGVQGGWQQGSGYNAGVTFSHRWDNVEESDAQFFKDWMKKAGSWLKNPENLQKVVDVYRTVRSDDDEESDQNNNFNFGANVNNGQWGVNGQYQRQWNGGNTNLGVQGGWQQGSGYNAGVTFSHRWDDAEDEESDFSLPSWVNWENAQKAYNVYQMLKRDEEDDEEADLSLPSWVNWDNAQKAIQLYQMFRRDQDDDADEESDAEFIKSVWKKVGPIAKELGKNYLRSKGIPLSDSEFSFKKVFKKVVPVLKTVGKMYLRTQGIPLADSDSQFFKDWMKKAGSWLKNPENLQKVVDVYRTVRSDDEDDDEESDFSFGGFGGYRPPRCVCVRAPCPC